MATVKVALNVVSVGSAVVVCTVMLPERDASAMQAVGVALGATQTVKIP